MQHTSQILMIEPVRFDFNEETAVNNLFQVKSTNPTILQEKALAEFTGLVNLLEKAGVDVLVVKDSPLPHTPDSLFPNNWLSMHEDGTLLLYPMFAPNRRKERKQTVLDALREKYRVEQIVDLSDYENQNLFLEGTGSMVLDRQNHIAYACLSQRTHRQLLDIFAEKKQYRIVAFTSVDSNRQPVYHTNVMMSVADEYAVICLDSIPDETERRKVSLTIQDTGKEIIPISMDQMNHFAGNMLQVHSKQGEPLLVMSSQAFYSLRPDQLTGLEKFNRILHTDLSTIETNGGGSARCMMAEIFLPVK
ncbi:MAG: amidinotransferase [Bacteroidota bacterium]|nr:amidinotransferase [Bacteroidota bacterium]